MKKKKLEKVLVLLLSLCMIVQPLPVNAYADETVQTTTYYVGGQNANNANDGLSNIKPLATVAAAADKINAAGAGNYKIIIQGPTEETNNIAIGDSASYINVTIIGAENMKPEDAATGGALSYSVTGSAIILRNKSYNGDLFKVNKNATLTLGDSTTTSNAKLYLDGGNNTDEYGSLVNVEKDGTLNLYSNVTLRNNKRSESNKIISSAIYNKGTTMINGGVITGNSAAFGAAICNSGNLLIKNGSINQNKSKYGTIYNMGNCQISGGTISNNMSENGAGICNVSTVIMTGGMITDNIASKQGGGIYNRNTFTISGGYILNNSATEEGGGIYNDKNLTLACATIKDNSSKEAGGAVYNYPSADFNISGNILMPSDGNTNDVIAQQINIKGFLSCAEPILITQKPYTQGTQLLKGSSEDIAAAVSCFFFKDSNFRINSSGIVEYTGAPATYYVGGADAKEGNDGKSPFTPFVNLTQAVAANAGGTCTIIVQGDIVLTDTVSFSGNVTLETDGTAHRISTSVGKPLIRVVSGVLNLGNTNNSGSDLLCIVPDDNNAKTTELILIDSDAVLNIYSETTIKGWLQGACLIYNSGKLHISGGSITGNKFYQIILNSSEMTMTGGRIVGNSAIGIVNEKNCYMSGGILENNTEGEIIHGPQGGYDTTLSLSNNAKIVTSETEPFCIRLGSIYSSVRVADNMETDNKYTISCDKYNNGLTVLTGTDDLVKANRNHFTLANKDYKIDASGKIISVSEGKTYYVGSMQTGIVSDLNTGADKEHPFATLEKALDVIGKGVGTIIIQSDITVNKTLKIAGDVTIISDGAKHTIIRSDSFTGIMIINTGSLTLDNKDNSGNDNKPDLIFDGNKSKVQAKYTILFNMGLVNLYSGVSFENNYSTDDYYAGGIANQGICYMYGGSVRNNGGDMTEIGGVKCLYYSIFIMKGGSISNNIGAVAGVTVDQCANFIMDGGTIESNSSNGKGSDRAGVVISNTGSFTMNGGTISGNSGRGAGIAISGEYNAIGTPETTLKLNGGSISHNKGTFSGVMVNGSSIHFGISKDVAVTDGDRIYLTSDHEYSAIIMDGALTGKSQEFNLSYIKISNVDASYSDEHPVGRRVIVSTSGYSFTEQDLAKFKLDNQDYTINREGYYSKAIKNGWVKISDDSNMTENGEPKTVTVSVSDGNTVLTAGTDYTVSYSDNIHTGTATVKITGIRNYGAVITRTFAIKASPAVPTPTTEPVVLPDTKNNAVSTPIPTAVPTSAPTISPSSGVLNLDAELSAQTDNKGGHIISVPEDKLKEQLQDKGITKVNLNVITQSGYTDIILQDEILKAAKGKGKDLSVVVKDNRGKVRYSWNFNKDNLTENQNNIKDVNVSLEVTTVKDKLPEISEETAGLVINFAEDGSLPAQAAVKIYVGDQQGIKPSEKIYLYHWNKSTDKLETLPYSSNYMVDADGYITINIVHCSDYVILTKPAVKGIVVGLTDQISVTVNKKVLALHKKAKVNLRLPCTLEMVSSLTERTSQSAIGSAMVSYSSNHKKVVTINKEGVITAVGKGNATITTTITLYNKKKKKVRTNIKVITGA